MLQVLAVAQYSKENTDNCQQFVERIISDFSLTAVINCDKQKDYMLSRASMELLVWLLALPVCVTCVEISMTRRMQTSSLLRLRQWYGEWARLAMLKRTSIIKTS